MASSSDVHASFLFLLQTPENVVSLGVILQSSSCLVESLIFTGFEGMGRHNYRPLLDDATFQVW